METPKNNPTTKRSKKKIFFKTIAVFTVILAVISFYLYNNFNNLLSAALLKNFNSNVISNVYELNFEKLRVNIIDGDITVFSVVFKPREKPLNDYPYINSKLRLYTKKIHLTNVHIFELLKENKLNLEKVEIIKPEIQFKLTGKFPVFFPVKDSATVVKKNDNKKFIEHFNLKEFRLVYASIQIFNSYKERDFKISNFNITINDFEIDQKNNTNVVSVGNMEMLIGEFKGKLLNAPVRHISFSNYKIKFDSLLIRKSIDTTIYKFKDFNVGLESLNVHTADSLFNLKLQNFYLSYKEKSIILKGISYKPNVSRDVIQKKFKFQNSQFSAEIGSLSIVNLNFDSLMYSRKIYIDNISLNDISASLFQNNAKLLDKSKFPLYLGQVVNSIPFSLQINKIKVANTNLEYIELKPDHGTGKVNVNRGTVVVENITNISGEKPLTVMAEAYLENKVKTVLNLAFSYSKPEFNLQGEFTRFNLTDLNAVINSFTPAKIHNGIVDQISFSGTVFKSYSTGTMKFLYHDLKVDLDIQNKAKWKNSVGAFAANAIVNSSNPPSTDLPPRIVKYRAERIMNKGFINIIVKSALMGIKETMIMSKENRKAYNKSKKESKQNKK